MAFVEVYSTETCWYCVRAKELLERKAVEFEEIDVSADPGRKDEMIRRSGRRTVPQIFIDGVSIGGCDDLYELDSKGKLDSLLDDS